MPTAACLELCVWRCEALGKSACEAVRAEDTGWGEGAGVERGPGVRGCMEGAGASARGSIGCLVRRS